LGNEAGVAGVTVIDCNIATFTVRFAVAVLPPKAAVMTAEPLATPVARPVPEPIVAMPVALELQTIPVAAVMSICVPKLYVAIAVNCWVVVTGIEGAAGVTAIDTNVSGVTVRLTVALLPPIAAVMTDVPLATPAAIPVAETVATPVSAEDQAIPGDVVTSWVKPSLYVAVAVNCWMPLTGIEGVAGVTATETTPGKFTELVVPPHPATKATISSAMNHMSGFVRLLNLFI
jgi:hypothetical protein